MRGDDQICGKLFSYRDREERVRADHRLRPIRKIANAALAALSGEFAALYCAMGGPSVPPEKLLRAMLLQAFYSVRSERQAMERIEFDLLFPGSSASASTTGMGPLHLHKEPRPASGRRDRRQVSGGGAVAAAGQAAAVERAFLGRRHADPSLGLK
jgi:hypothetical protein